MKQELAPRGVGIPGLQAGEDVKLCSCWTRPTSRDCFVSRKRPSFNDCRPIQKHYRLYAVCRETGSRCGERKT